MKYTEDEMNFLKDNYANKGRIYCSNFLKRDPEAIGAKAKRMGLKVENNFQPPELCKNFKYNIINQPTKEFAYFLGFMWADGYILHKIDTNGFNHNRIVCEIVSEDFDDVFSNFTLFSKWSISIRKRKSSWKETTTGTINNKYLYEFLHSLNFKDKNSGFVKVKDYLDKYELFDYFILGLFDGDGHTNFKNRIELSGPIQFDWSSWLDVVDSNNISYGVYDYTHPTKNHSSRKFLIQNIEGYRWFEKRFLLPNSNFGLLRKRPQ